MSGTIEVLDGGQAIAFSFDDLLKYHGPGSPGGVAHAYKVLERAFELLSPDGPPRRRDLSVRTSFGGPGARDGFEMVTRAVTGDRYTVDSTLARPEAGRTRENFVFEVGYGEDRSVTLVLREGYVVEEFIDLLRKERTDAEKQRLEVLKQELAERVMASPASEVYEEG